jgi:hypothetical protein
MAERQKASALNAGLVAKGEAKPAAAPTNNARGSIPRGTKGTVSVTVRLDPERYKRLVAHGAQMAPRVTNQQILVEALDAYLAQHEA